MIEIGTDLKERFDSAAIWFFERSDVMHGVEADLSDEDAKAVDILTNLRDSVDAIPPSLIDDRQASHRGPGIVRKYACAGRASSWLRLLSGHCDGICQSSESNRSAGCSLNVSNLGTIAIALLSWIVFNTIGQSLLRFFDPRTEVRRIMVFYDNVTARRCRRMSHARDGDLSHKSPRHYPGLRMNPAQSRCAWLRTRRARCKN
jgi:hypothetical protein